ncbi:MAG: 16S rRNA (guanine(527)-N(7))-methyltransferase RsmG [Opitutales bacterium]|nr:16S rRNA (guanine(527)-N(7))-methyltransferase RsmG [Opitutales bacterium]
MVDETDLVAACFPDLGPPARERLRHFAEVFKEWNTRINLVSRKDIDAFEEHHLLHSLAVGAVVPFPDRARVLDVGTGGGLPGLPLAIMYPRVRFFLCDSIAKKARAVGEMAEALGLKNVEVVHKRAETLESKWDFVLGRAVAALPVFLGWIAKNLREGGAPECPNGVLYLKGTKYTEELAPLGIEPFRVTELRTVVDRPYFDEKFLVHLPAGAVRRCRHLVRA